MSDPLVDSYLKDFAKQGPKHVAIIMDGNGRWAKSKGLKRSFGHSEGGKRTVEVILCAREINLQVLTLFCFSTENWKRSQDEIDFIMQLMLDFIDKKTDLLHEKGIKIQCLGELHRAPKLQREAIKMAEEKTKNNTKMLLNLCVSYGSRQEITRACTLIAEKIENNELKSSDITEEVIQEHLYTRDILDPDLIIRSSGENRLSNFLLWQAAYSEIFISSQDWPEFKSSDFVYALIDFTKRDRRFGKEVAPTTMQSHLESSP